MRKLILLIIVAVFISGCTQETKRITVEFPTVRASELYNADTISKFVVNLSDQQKEIANNFLSRSIENKEADPEKSIYFLKRSLTLFPNLDGYRLLGELLIDNKRFTEANDLYYFLTNPLYRGPKEFVFDKPNQEDYYNYILSYIIKYKSLDSYHIGEISDNGGDIQRIRQRLMKEDRLKMDTSSYAFKNIIAQFWTEKEIESFINSPQNFKGFLSSFSDTVSEFEITDHTVSNFKYSYESFYNEGIELSDFYRYFLEEASKDQNFYRMYNANHRFTPSYGYTAVVYAVDSSQEGCTKEMRELYHKLVIYDNNGKISDALIVAKQNRHEVQSVRFLNSGSTIEITRMTRSWKNPYRSDDPDNELVAMEFAGKFIYTIKKGKIELSEESEF